MKKRLKNLNKVSTRRIALKDNAEFMLFVSENFRKLAVVSDYLNRSQKRLGRRLTRNTVGLLIFTGYLWVENGDLKRRIEKLEEQTQPTTYFEEEDK